MTIFAGERGQVGENGARGDAGEKGDKGAQGIEGEFGDAGLRGIVGDRGASLLELGKLTYFGNYSGNCKKEV